MPSPAKRPRTTARAALRSARRCAARYCSSTTPSRPVPRWPNPSLSFARPVRSRPAWWWRSTARSAATAHSPPSRKWSSATASRCSASLTSITSSPISAIDPISARRGRPFTVTAPNMVCSECSAGAEQNQTQAHQHRDDLVARLDPLVALDDGEMRSKVAAGERPHQQRRQPAPADLAEQLYRHRAAAIPEVADQDVGVGHRALVVEAKPAHQPEGDEQAGARRERTVQHAYNEQTETTHQVAGAVAVMRRFRQPETRPQPRIHPEGYRQHTQTDACELFGHGEDQAGAQHHAGYAGREDEQRERQVQPPLP